MCALLFEGMATILATRLRLFGQPSAEAILFEGMLPVFGATLLGLITGWILVAGWIFVSGRKPPPCLGVLLGIVGGFVGFVAGVFVANSNDLPAGSARERVLWIGAFAGAALGTVLCCIWPSKKKSDEPPESTVGRGHT